MKYVSLAAIFMSSLMTDPDDSAADGVRPWQAPVVEGPITGQHDMPAGPPTAKQVQLLQKDAYNEAFARGREEGLKSGYDEGIEQAKARYSAQITTFQNLILQLAAPLSDLDEELENNIVALTIQIARHLVRRELKLEPGEVVAVVREAVNVLPVSALHPRVYLHPEDAELVRSALKLDEEASWRLEEDPTMTRGDCRVETESSLIDASVDARLSAIAAKLLGGARDSDRDA